jgi:hypothetical protein
MIPRDIRSRGKTRARGESNTARGEQHRAPSAGGYAVKMIRTYFISLALGPLFQTIPR